MTMRFPVINRREALALGAGLGAMLGLGPVAARAQSGYPSGPVRFVVPVSPGGSTDRLARTVGESLGRSWGNAVIVENMTGAGGTIGANAIVTSKPDGQNLLLHSDAILLNTLLYSKPRYTMADLVPVVKIAANAQIIVVRPTLGISTLKEYLDLSKSSGGLSVALPTQGGIAHIAHEILVGRTGIPVNYIPYEGGAPAATDVMGGHVDATIITLAAVTDYIAAGQLVPIAVTTAERQGALPNTPTIAESGVDGYEVESWQGIFAPAGTSDEIVRKINTDVNAILDNPESRAQIEGVGFGIGGGSADTFAAELVKSAEIYGKVIQDAGLVQR